MFSKSGLYLLVAAAVSLGLQALPPPAHAAVIVSDDFNNNGSPAANGTSLAGLKPDLADLPGTSYSVYTASLWGGYAQPGIDSTAGNSAPSANTGFNGATYLNIASANSYTLPGSVTLSASVQLNTIQMSSGNYFRGVGLGFAAGVQSSNSGDASVNFTGLVVNPDGTLRLVTPGTSSGVGSTIYYAAPFSGFSAANFYNLTYTVNLTTGSITSVDFNGNNDTAAFSGATGQPGFEFSAASPTVLASFYGSTDSNASDFGRVDNFSVSGAVPEPAALGLVAAGALGLLLLGKRRKAV